MRLGLGFEDFVKSNNSETSISVDSVDTLKHTVVTSSTHLLHYTNCETDVTLALSDDPDVTSIAIERY